MTADSAPIAAELARERLDAITGRVIGSGHAVNANLGCGFLEKVYENALAIELQDRGSKIEQQRHVQVLYKGRGVGDYIPDLIVEEAVIVEVKALAGLERIHRQQCINYLRATGYRVCLLLNFGTPRLQVERLVWRF